jgi:hypothetical protein
MTRKWYESKDKIMESFLTAKRKDFLRNYETVEDIIAEPSIKKQLYIYYIIQKVLFKEVPAWYWNYGYNFGCFEDYKGAKSIFSNGLIFQQYNTAFRENEHKIIWIQKNMKNGAKKIEELLTWSKS